MVILEIKENSVIVAGDFYTKLGIGDRGVSYFSTGVVIDVEPLGFLDGDGFSARRIIAEVDKDDFAANARFCIE